MRTTSTTKRPKKLEHLAPSFPPECRLKLVACRLEMLQRDEPGAATWRPGGKSVRALFVDGPVRGVDGTGGPGHGTARVDFSLERIDGTGTQAGVHFLSDLFEERVLFPNPSKCFGNDVLCVQLGVDSFEDPAYLGAEVSQRHVG